MNELLKKDIENLIDESLKKKTNNFLNKHPVMKKAEVNIIIQKFWRVTVSTIQTCLLF